MRPERIEWPTVGVAMAIASGLVALVGWGDRLPALVTVVAFGLIAAWYNSLQHEVIHGHPTRWRAMNDAMASIPIGLVHPFERYRHTHLAHHADDVLTVPGLDPESFYVDAAEWAAMSSAQRRLRLALQTMVGRLVLGPPVYALRFWRRELGTARHDSAVRREIVLHVVGAGAVVAVVAAAPVAVWVYVVGTSWVGASLSLIRSFAEHRAVESGTRTAVVRTGRFWSLLFLNNNLHVTHHAHPGLAWYRLPDVHEVEGADLVAREGAGLYRGYRELLRRYALRPTWVPIAPPSLRTP